MSVKPSDGASDRPSVSDEEWAEFVAAAKEQGLGTEAQDRALRKAKPPKRPKAPKAPKAPKRQEPPGWRTGPAWQEMNGRAQRKRRLKAVLGVALAVGLALVAVRPELVTGLLPEGVTSALPSSWTDRPEDTTPLAAETARPTAAPEPVDPHRPTVKEPFRGSPAVRWGNGAAGIELPPAKATGWMSKKQVEAALKKSREFLVAANLDPAVLRGDRPDAALKLIDPTQRDLRTQLEGWLAKPTDKNNPTTVFSRFTPVEVKPAGTVVKVRGRMSAAPGKGKRAGTVEVTADYTFVYPVLKAGPGADEVARTIVRREMTFVFYDPARYQVSSGKVVIGYWNSDIGNSSCELDGDGFLHPEFESDLRNAPAPSAGATGPAVDPYDRSKPIDRNRTGDCGIVSRS